MALSYEKFWTDKIHCDDAERKYNEYLSKVKYKISIIDVELRQD